MVPFKRITKEFLKEHPWDSVFINGTDLHPNPSIYKYYFWIYSMESKEESADEVFYEKEYRMSIKEFQNEYDRLHKNKISFAYLNEKYRRLGTIFDYEKLKRKYPGIKFAPAFNDDEDEMTENGHK